jgi:hypothetical protein
MPLGFPGAPRVMSIHPGGRLFVGGGPVLEGVGPQLPLLRIAVAGPSCQSREFGVTARLESNNGPQRPSQLGKVGLAFGDSNRAIYRSPAFSQSSPSASPPDAEPPISTSGETSIVFPKL